MALKNQFFIGCLLIFIWGADCPDNFIEIDEICYFKKHLDVLQDFIDRNESLYKMEPLELGFQDWNDNRLTYLYLGDLHITTLPDSIGLLKDLNSLDLRKNEIITLPEGICSLYPYYTQLNISENQICPPYPYCFDYISSQNTNECDSINCPKEYIEIQGECYFEKHIQILQSIIDSNNALSGHSPLELGSEIGYQQWEHGQLTHLNLVSNQLTTLPDNLCTVIGSLKSFDVSNNYICPPYPDCFEFIGYQNTEDCEHSFCPYGYLDLDGDCYYENDISMLQEFISQNKSLFGRQPLDIGVQKWKNMRLYYLYLGINQLTSVPESICEILPNLKTLNISQNNICPSYPICIEDFIGVQDESGCP